jgi:Holliday junction DNA helicase RuvA
MFGSMIEHITGELRGVEPTAVVVDLHGLGIRVEVAPAVASRLGALGSKVSLLTHLTIGGQSDPAPRLFGFSTTAQRVLFRHLITVSGVGPSTALRVLSAHDDAGRLAAAIARGDEDAVRVKGVGQKIATRIVTELRDKVAGLADAAPVLTASGSVVRPAPAAGDRATDDALRALKSLEFEPDEARRLLRDVQAELPGAATADELVRAVLLRV